MTANPLDDCNSISCVREEKVQYPQASEGDRRSLEFLQLSNDKSHMTLLYNCGDRNPPNSYGIKLQSGGVEL